MDSVEGSVGSKLIADSVVGSEVGDSVVSKETLPPLGPCGGAVGSVPIVVGSGAVVVVIGCEE